MSTFYADETGAWQPFAREGGLVEKYQLNASGGSTNSPAIIQADDRIWDHLEPYAGGTSLAFGFYSMPGITRVPMFDTSSVTDLHYTFSGCSSLMGIPELDTSSATRMTFTFRNCSSLVEIPLLDTSNVTAMDSMFSGCTSLVEIPTFDTSNVTTMGSMFSGCSSLVGIPELDTSSATSMGSMFYGCSSLVEIPELDTSNVTSMNSMFYGCSSLVEIPELDMSSVSSSLGSFAGGANASSQLSSLTRFRAFGARRGFFLRGTQMDAGALNELMSNLGTANGTQTLDIGGNPGSSTCDPSIATAKGWTVKIT